MPRAGFAQTLDEAIALAEENPDVTFVTQAGEIVRGPLLRLAGPRNRASGTFELERDRAEIGERTEAARRSIATADAARTNLAAARDRLEAEIGTAREYEARRGVELSPQRASRERRIRDRSNRREHDRLPRSGPFALRAAALSEAPRAFEEEEQRWRPRE